MTFRQRKSLAYVQWQGLETGVIHVPSLLLSHYSNPSRSQRTENPINAVHSVQLLRAQGMAEKSRGSEQSKAKHCIVTEISIHKLVQSNACQQHKIFLVIPFPSNIFSHTLCQAIYKLLVLLCFIIKLCALSTNKTKLTSTDTKQW